MLGKDEESVSDQMNDVLAQVSGLKFKMIYSIYVVLFVISIGNDMILSAI